MDEEKKVFKINLKTLILLIIIIVLLVVIVIMGFMMSSLKNYNQENSQASAPKENDNDQQIVSNVIENEVENEIDNKVKNKVSNKTKNTTKNETSDSNGNVEYVKKIVNSKGYVYNAQYSVENLEVQDYQTNDGTTHSASDIVLPFINMQSDDADDVNDKIEELYEKYLNEFKVCSENKNSFIKVNYQTFITANITSILVTVQRGREDTQTNEYLSYIFDAVSGTELSYDQTYGLIGIKNIEESVKNAILNLEDFDEYRLNDKYPQEARDARDEEIENCQTQIYTYYQQDLLNNTLAYYLDNNLKLNIVVRVVLPANGGEYLKIIVVE